MESESEKNSEGMAKELIVQPSPTATKENVRSDCSDDYDSAEGSDESCSTSCSLDLVSVDSLQLKNEIREALKADGTLNANSFLKHAIEAYSKGGHVMVQADTGKERFRALSICALDQVDKAGSDSVQVLIVSPFRDDAVEILSTMQSLNSSLGYRMLLCAAGSSIEYDHENLTQQKPQIVLGTPGRLVDLILKDHLDAKSVRLLMIDGAENLFNRRLRRNGSIFGLLPRNVQYVFFVAKVTSAVENFIKDPSMDVLGQVFKKDINLGQKINEPTGDKKLKEGVAGDVNIGDPSDKKGVVPHYFVYTSSEERKFDELLKIFDRIKLFKTMVTCKSAPIAEKIAAMLTQKGLPYWFKPQQKDMRMSEYINQFNSAEAGVIVITYENVRLIREFSAVINFNLPSNRDFLNKLMATLRKHSGKKGGVVSFMEDADIGRLFSKAYRTTLATKMPEDVSAFF